MKLKLIVIHCSDSPQGRGDNAETIHKWHRKRKFAGIGYHHVVLENGVVENGRPIFWEGAHVKGFNTNSIGICLIGKDSFTSAQMDTLTRLLLDYTFDHPDVEIAGHYQLDEGKTCPNIDIPKYLKSIGLYDYRRL